MSTKVQEYNKIQTDLRKFYEENFIVLVIHLITNKIMSMASIAKVLGVTRFAIISRVNRYKSEQEEEEEEEEEDRGEDQDDNFATHLEDAVEAWENHYLNSFGE